MTADYVVVGSGLTGATIARTLADAGREVIVIERRRQVGGNVHDFRHPSGVRIHSYGPHYFRTGSRRIWEHARRFASFYAFEARVLTVIDGQLEPWPPGKRYLSRIAAAECPSGLPHKPRNFEDACLAMLPKVVFDKFVKGYTEKQWGVPVSALAPELAQRLQFRVNNDTRLTRHAYQGLPAGGYHQWMKAMLAGISVFVGVDYLHEPAKWRHRKQLVFTGSLDEYFGFALGSLTYRAQRRCHMYYPNQQFRLRSCQVNNPDPASPHVRLLEWKHMMEPDATSAIVGTVVTSETPFTAQIPDAYEYPFPDTINRSRYEEYRRMAQRIPSAVFCGRLGEYRYYDMDQAIGRAMVIARGLLN